VFPRTIALPIHVLRVASVLALCSVLLTMAPPAAQAHSGHGFTLELHRLHAFTTTGDPGSDEPYVLMAAVNLLTREVFVRRTSVFGDVDDGESRYETKRVWGPLDTVAPFPGDNPDNLVVVVVPMEHDNCNESVVMSRLRDGLRVRMDELASIPAVLPRDYIVAQLLDKADGITRIACIVWEPWKTTDDRIAPPRELRITSVDVAEAHSGTPVEKVLLHSGAGVAVYKTYFRLVAAGTPMLASTSSAAPISGIAAP
jgi:hypothetical protein